MLDVLRGSGHSQHYQECQTWLGGQTTYLQPDKKEVNSLSGELIEVAQTQHPENEIKKRERETERERKKNLFEHRAKGHKNN